MTRRLAAAWAVASVVLAASAAQAQPVFQQPASPPPKAGYAYLRDVIAVTIAGREHFPPTAACVVWVNAEGLGVGPEQLDGRHGLSFTLNPQPLPGEGSAPYRSADAFPGLQKANPSAPAWLMRTLSASGPAIDAACTETHLDPFVVKKLTAADAKK